MNALKKNKLLNLIMVVAIFAIITSGVLAVGRLQGWFDKVPEDARQAFVSGEKTGSVNIERGGVSYSMRNGTVLRDGDRIETLNASAVTLSAGGVNNVALGENSDARVSVQESVVFNLVRGEAFVDMSEEGSSCVIRMDDEDISCQNGVFYVSSRTGTKTIYVLAGEAGAKGVTARAGQLITLLTGKDGVTATVSGMTPEALNAFAIARAKTANGHVSLCYANSELDAVTARREEERQRALQALLDPEETDPGAAVVTIVSGGDASQSGHTDVPPPPTDTRGEGNKPAPGSSATRPPATSKGKGTTKTEPAVPAGPATTEKQTTTTTETAPAPASDAPMYCTLEIRCDTILDHMDWLVKGKEAYVPANGTILARSRIQFVDGETVFDVLKRACKRARIQLEYSWTPMYGSYYIEGINHLYEFDCGEPGNNLSGWMYKVNGWFPNYGCSSYTLKLGDVIVWCYTCRDLGEDVGCHWMN